MSKFRKVEFYKSYFDSFYLELPQKVRDKFIWTFELIEDLERVPEIYLKHIDDGIYEVRVKLGSNIYRVFSFFEGNSLIIIINGFQKKSKKTPKSEIVLAKKIRDQYEQEK